MLEKLPPLALLMLSGTSTTGLAASVNMNPGMWEWTTTVEMPGMPIQVPPQSYSACLTAADYVPKDSKLGQTCETIDIVTEGDKVSWNMTCTTPQGVVTSQGQITYRGDTAQGDLQVTATGMQMLSRITGQRLGPCP